MYLPFQQLHSPVCKVPKEKNYFEPFNLLAITINFGSLIKYIHRGLTTIEAEEALASSKKFPVKGLKVGMG